MADIFDELLHIEEEFLERGRLQGLADGEIQGEQEGREFGLAKGMEVGLEVGRAAAFAEMYYSLARANPCKFSDRCIKSLESLRSTVSRFPVGEPNQEIIFELLEDIRGRMRMLKSILNISSSAASSASALSTVAASAPNGDGDAIVSSAPQVFSF